MQQQQPARCQTAPVDVGALAGEQVERNGIAGECVNGNEVVLTGLARGEFALQLHARVAQHGFSPRFRVAQERKPAMRERIHIGVDFIEAKCIAGAPPRRQRPRAQPNYSDSPIGTLQRVERDRHAAVRPIIRSRPLSLRAFQILKPVPSAPMPQLPKLPIAVTALDHTQNSVEVPRAGNGWLVAGCDSRHDRGESAEQQRHERNTYAELAALPLHHRAAAQPSDESKQACGCQTDGIFKKFGEHVRRDQRDKHPAQRTACRDSNVEGRQIARRGPRSREFAVAQHARNQHGRQIHHKLPAQREHAGKARHHAAHRCQNAGRARKQRPMIEAIALKRENEGRQINRQRRDPQERIHRDLLRDLIGGRQQQGRAAGRQSQPE